ncbi:MAG: 50S ribosomal protein L24 [Gammaproteobacteria bacterium]|nr:MAG: 50S ribosomal protein L24 [Gammaproteobacteria bacterium]
MRKLRRDDEVVILTGKDRGKRGKIVRVLQDADQVLVAGINVAKRHTRPNPQMGVTGGIVEKEMPIDISNVAILNPKTQKADKVAIKVLEDNTRIRVFKSTGEAIDG